MTKYPTGLKKAGKDTWDAIWSIVHIEQVDAFAVTRICKKVDEINRMEAVLAKQGDLIGINHNKETGEPTNWILHPYRKQIQEEEKLIIQLLIQLGITTKSRIELGLAEEKTQSRIGGLLAAQASFKEALK